MNSIKCPICNSYFKPSSNSQKHCDKCKSKYEYYEREAIIGYKEGVYTNELAKKLYTLQKEGKSNPEIAKMLNIKTPLINAILKFSTVNFNNYIIDEEIKHECPTCGKIFKLNKFNKNQKYCDECKLKYSDAELNILTNIKKGLISQKTLNEITELFNQGYSKKEIEIMFNIKPGDLDPLLKFLPVKEMKTEKYKKCLLCGNKFPIRKNAQLQKYCDDCKSKYKPIELETLIGYKNGIYTDELAKKIYNLRKENMTNKKIGKKLNIKPSLISSIIKFSSIDFNNYIDETNTKKDFKLNENQNYYDEYEQNYLKNESAVLANIKKGEITQEISNKINELLKQGYTKTYIATKFNINSSDINFIFKFLPPEGLKRKKVYKCILCKKKVTTNNNHPIKYCDECKSKYNPLELETLVGYKNGIYTNEIAKKLYDLQKKGKSNIEIAKKFNIHPSSLVKYIIKYSSVNFDNSVVVKEDIKKCPICNSYFNLTSQSQKYCKKCQTKYTPVEIETIIGYKEGIYTDELAKKLYTLQKEGKSNPEIAKIHNIKTHLINAIIKFSSIDFNDKKEKKCIICKTKTNNAEYCDECQLLFTKFERETIAGYKKEIYTDETAEKIYKLQEKGKTKSEIGQILNIKYSLIKPLLEFSPITIKNKIIKENNPYKCPICGKNISHGDYCDECYSNYPYYERETIIGYKKGIYTDNLAKKIYTLQKKGKNNKKIRKMLNVSTSFIDPILKFSSIDFDEEVIEEDNIYKCSFCGKEFKSNFNTKSKYCDECKSKYNSLELETLNGYKEGIYTDELAKKLYILQKKGKTNAEIGKIVNIKSNLINTIIKYSSIDFEKYNIEEKNENTCHICGKKFKINRSNKSKKYCDECKSKYPAPELNIIAKIKKGLITQKTSNKINKLINQGHTKKNIALKLKINSNDINTILKFFPPETIIKQTTKCLLCGNEFPIEKNIRTIKYCTKCKSKYTPPEIEALMGLKEGIYTKEIIEKMKRLEKRGYTKKSIGTQLKIKPSLITPILKFSNLQKINICPICGEKFKINNNIQKFCKDCDKNFSKDEKEIILKIKNKTYTETTYKNIRKLKLSGKSDLEVINNLNLKNEFTLNYLIQYYYPIVSDY